VLGNNNPNPVSVTGDGIIEAFAWASRRAALHLLNYTNPNMTRGFIRRFYLIGQQRVELATDKRIKSVGEPAAGGARHQTDRYGSVLRRTSITDYEVIAADLRAASRPTKYSL
jgi:hypothetical protein